MFNGIIKRTGTINKILKKNNNCIIEIQSKMKFSHDDIGSSISCSGTCLTLEKYKKKISKFYISRETLNKTTFGSSKKGDLINLEKSLKYGERVSGHIVQGHVDTTCKVSKIKFLGKTWMINFILNRKYKKYLVYKGSIAINGVSLTVAKITKEGFQIAVIPKTLELTNLINIKKGKFVNVEFDIFAKYIKNFIK
tara:strand:- start:712 stop:1296 length:585 start_codon:yes stop_codon:yes gene_type:complete